MSQELDQVLNLYKKKSETPLQTIERFVAAHPQYAKVKMTYAGRLDPMAEGLLLVLSGEKNKERDAYTGLDKDYEFEFILGLDTDTHDVLGKIVDVFDTEAKTSDLKKALLKYVGTFRQKYPAYSSKVVNGIPLFDYARRGKIDMIVRPEHDVTVSKLELISERTITKDALWEEIEGNVKAVKGDFRQKETLNGWHEYFNSAQRDSFTIYKLKVSCGSGFYVRQLVADLGKDLGTGAVTTSILRTRVGEYKLEDSVK
jgi:tRNA pseudouridine55 synthase